MSGLSFQLASLEENAAINLWVIWRCYCILVDLFLSSLIIVLSNNVCESQVVVELDRANDAGSESDLGQWQLYIGSLPLYLGVVSFFWCPFRDK